MTVIIIKRLKAHISSEADKKARHLCRQTYLRMPSQTRKRMRELGCSEKEFGPLKVKLLPLPDATIDSAISNNMPRLFPTT